ncbi:MAG: T9SS type A sorting domain-containing protein [Flavobacteriia bacterium]|nr:T9SS type A sorting domain-containing protein [Flavobacteriia bacterium]MBH2023128.1 T9SS type A sorting domain-containing protein [Flavobacteriales bacterium]
MKKILFFLFIANFFSAQNPDLLNTNWKITKMVSEIRPDQFPPPMPYEQVSHFSTTAPQLSLSFFNIVSANLTFSGQNIFTVSNKTCTYADYWDDNGEVNQFFDSLCAFFDNGNTYHYYIGNSGSNKTLVIHSAIFEEIHFTSTNLATTENKLSQYALAPNPVNRILTVQNSVGINSVQIFDLLGKLVHELKNNNAKTLDIDMQNFKTGIYFIKLNNDKTFKIIKE